MGDAMDWNATTCCPADSNPWPRPADKESCRAPADKSKGLGNLIDLSTECHRKTSRRILEHDRRRGNDRSLRQDHRQVGETTAVNRISP